jgi:hypothetical protein
MAEVDGTVSEAQFNLLPLNGKRRQTIFFFKCFTANEELLALYYNGAHFKTILKFLGLCAHIRMKLAPF